MINISKAYKALIKQSEEDKLKELYKISAIHYDKPFLFIGIDLMSFERKLYIDISGEQWSQEQLKAFPKWKGLSIAIEYFDQMGILENRHFLIISQEVEQSEEILEKFLQNLVDHIVIAEEKPLYTVVFEVLDRWHNFFRNRSNKKLSLEEQMGIFGELHYIQTYLNKYPDEPPLIINYWHGPLQHRIDFVKANIGIEIKTISPKLRDEIRISNEKQLELNDIIKSIYLYILEIEETQSDGQTIQDLIESIKCSLEKRSLTALVKFKDLLMKLYIQDGIYNDISFYIHKETAYEVNDAFPKITGEQLPLGITNLSYSLDLSHCESFKIETNQVYSFKKVDENDERKQI